MLSLSLFLSLSGVILLSFSRVFLALLKMSFSFFSSPPFLPFFNISLFSFFYIILIDIFLETSSSVHRGYHSLTHSYLLFYYFLKINIKNESTQE